jgi:Holliday junction DNA helicase RuvA
VYHHLRGKLVEIGPMLAIVEVGGIGFQVRVPLSTLETLGGKTEVLLYTSLEVREDGWKLFGFATRGERELFDLLVSVSGVGPSVGLAALSALSTSDLVRALSSGQSDLLRRIKGVGKKLADRLVVELKDHPALAALALAGEPAAAAVRARSPGAPLLADPQAADAVAALVELGYQRRAAEERVEASYRRWLETQGENGRTAGAPGPTVEQLLREALRR